MGVDFWEFKVELNCKIQLQMFGFLINFLHCLLFS